MLKANTLGLSQHSTYDEDMDTEIGARVRERLRTVLPGTSQAEIARRLELAPDAFSRALNGKRAFSAVELVELAALLKTSAHWFVTGESDPFEVSVAGRHAYDSTVEAHLAVDWSGAEAKIGDVLLAYRQVIDPATSPVVRRVRAPKEARAALEEIGGEGFVRDLATHVETAFGIDIVRIPGLEREYSVEVVGRSVILVNETPNWFRENFGIAHELAHLLRGDLAAIDDSACDDSSAERAANAFAAELLMPQASLAAFPWATADEVTVAGLVWRLGVSTDALRRRLARLRIDVGGQAVAALEHRTQSLLQRAGVPAGEPEAVAARMRDAATRRFPAHLIEAHREAIAAGRLGAATLGWMLGVPMQSIEAELAPKTESADLDALGRELGLLG